MWDTGDNASTLQIRWSLAHAECLGSMIFDFYVLFCPTLGLQAFILHERLSSYLYDAI